MVVPLVALNAVNGIEEWEINLENSNIGSASASLGDFASDPAVCWVDYIWSRCLGETFSATKTGKFYGETTSRVLVDL